MCAKTLKLKKLTIVAKLHVVNSHTTTHITFSVYKEIIHINFFLFCPVSYVYKVSSLFKAALKVALIVYFT